MSIGQAASDLDLLHDRTVEQVAAHRSGAGPELDQLEAQYDLLVSHLDKGRVLQAETVLHDLRRTMQRADSLQIADLTRRLDDDERVQLVATNAQSVKKVLIESESQRIDWTIAAHDESRSLTTSYRLNDNMKTLSMKVEALRMDCPIFDFLALINEMDLLAEMLSNPLASIDVDLIKQIGMFRKLLHLGIHPLWPVPARDLVIDFAGFNVLDTQAAVVLAGRSFDRVSFHNVVAPPVPNRCTRVDLFLSGVVLRPLSETSISLIATFSMDLHMPFVPITLVNFIIKQLTMPMFKVLANRAESLHSSDVHQQRIRDDTIGIYKLIRSELEEFDYSRNSTRQSIINMNESLLTESLLNTVFTT